MVDCLGTHRLTLHLPRLTQLTRHGHGPLALPGPIVGAFAIAVAVVAAPLLIAAAPVIADLLGVRSDLVLRLDGDAVVWRVARRRHSFWAGVSVKIGRRLNMKRALEKSARQDRRRPSLFCLHQCPLFSHQFNPTLSIRIFTIQMLCNETVDCWSYFHSLISSQNTACRSRLGLAVSKQEKWTRARTPQAPQTPSFALLHPRLCHTFCRSDKRSHEYLSIVAQ